MLAAADLDAVDHRDAVAPARAHGAQGTRARHARVLREAARPRSPRRRRADRRSPRSAAWSRRWATTTASSAPSARSSASSTPARSGAVTTALAEAYGPVVLKPAGRTWRSQASTGGGCLYDYAAHPLDLLSWYLGAPTGSRQPARSASSRARLDDDRDRDAELPRRRHRAAHRELVGRVAAQDDDARSRLWGTAGRIFADRQEIQVYLRDTRRDFPRATEHGWNVRYTTELMRAPWFYLRGEEYSAQLDAFVQRIRDRHDRGRERLHLCDPTDRPIAMIREDSDASRQTHRPNRPPRAVRTATTPPWLDRTERGSRALRAAERAAASGMEALRARRNR